MTAYEMNKKIKRLGRLHSDEEKLRSFAQELLLTVELSKLDAVKKEYFKKLILSQIRSVSRTDYTDSEGETAEINSLVSELCLAADFFLLEKGKRVFPVQNELPVFATMCLRRFENSFFRILSILLKNNDLLTVRIKADEKSVFIIPSPEGFSGGISAAEYQFTLIENGIFSPVLKLERKSVSNPICEDFSLLLADTASPLHIWLGDI